MEKWIVPLLTLVALGLAGCTVTTGSSSTGEEQDGMNAGSIPAPALPNLGPAPELQNEVWLNVDGPLRLAELRSQVVLLDMWTFG